jgi:hypothetical protein
MSRDSSVIKVTDHNLDSQGLIPHKGRDFSSFHTIHASSGTNQPVIQLVLQTVSLVIKWPECDTTQTAFSAKV